MNPQLAFIEAKRTFESCVRGEPFRPVLLGLDGDVAKFRRGPVEMTWRYVAAKLPENVLQAARQVRGPNEVLVVPSMTRMGAAACTAYDTSWCDGEGRCNVAVRGDGWFETVKSWMPNLVEPRESVFVDPACRRFLTELAGQGGAAEVRVSVQDMLAPRLSTMLMDAGAGVGLIREIPGGYAFASRRLANATLEIMTMPDDPMMPPDPETSARMARIKSKDTAPELVVRRELKKRGVGYVLHDVSLPGTPDIVNKSRKWAVFVNGCFWHAHDCDAFRAPARNAAYWTEKFAATRERDEKARTLLAQEEYEVVTLWECELQDMTPGEWDELADKLKRR